nr:6-phosphofructokinase [Candidatus Omnitrophota bacterium]
MFKRIILFFYFAVFLLIFCDNASASSFLLRPPNITKYNNERLVKLVNHSKRLLVNPFLLFEAGRDRGDLTIDKKTIFVGMGGGDTAGLNDFVADTVEKLTKLGYKVIGIRSGFKGLLKGDKLEDNFVELTPEIAASMKGLPSMVLGSCREKLKEEDIAKIIDILKPSAGAIFIGGNDHLKNVEQIANEAGKQGIDITVVGVPKSIDNDFMTVMHGFWSAVIAGRQTVARVSINPEKEKDLTTAAVFECMGRKSGSLTLELSKGCPYSHVVIVPEKPVMIDDIINASNDGIRNFFVSEGFSLSEADPKLSQLLQAYPVLKTMWEKSRTSPDRDAHGNPKLTGASLFVKGILEHFCGLKVEKTDLTYQLRGAFLQPDNKGIIFDIFLAGKFSEEAASLIETKQSGLAVTYDGEYGDIKGAVKARLPKDVYKSRDLSIMLSDESLADLGVLGVSGYQIKYNAVPELSSEREISLEGAIREAFYGIAASTFAHRYASVVELREPSNVIISSCSKDQADIDKLPYDLKTVIEGTKDSVLLLVPEIPMSLSQIADSIKDICDKSGYINIAISKDFMLDPKDELLESVLNTDPVLRVRFNEGLVDEKTGMVRFESGISNFIAGLYKYLIKQGKIKVEGNKITNLGYAFKGLASGNASDLINRKVLDSGV